MNVKWLLPLLCGFYFVYGGNVNSSSLNNAGSNGYYWSSTANNASNAYNLNFNTSVNPSNNNNRYNGFSVRCVAYSNPGLFLMPIPISLLLAYPYFFFSRKTLLLSFISLLLDKFLISKNLSIFIMPVLATQRIFNI